MVKATEDNEVITEEYCCVCERYTSHRPIKSEIFDSATECLVCRTEWEVEDDSKTSSN